MRSPTAVLSACVSRQYSSQEVISALGRAGFAQVSQHGSHLKLRGLHGGQIRTVIVKHPAKRIPDGTFASILRQAGLRQAGMTRAEFEQLT